MKPIERQNQQIIPIMINHEPYPFLTTPQHSPESVTLTAIEYNMITHLPNNILTEEYTQILEIETSKANMIQPERQNNYEIQNTFIELENTLGENQFNNSQTETTHETETNPNETTSKQEIPNKERDKIFIQTQTCKESTTKHMFSETKQKITQLERTHLEEPINKRINFKGEQNIQWEQMQTSTYPEKIMTKTYGNTYTEKRKSNDEIRQQKDLKLTRLESLTETQNNDVIKSITERIQQ